MLLGEGEENFTAFLLCLMGDQQYESVASLVYRSKGEICITSMASRVSNFLGTASPYLDGTFDRLLQKYPGFFQMGMLETNRGCPFRCTFCDWSITRQVIEMPLDRVYQEIDWLIEHNFSNFCIIDANFGIRRRDHLIASYLAEQKTLHGKPSYCYFYLTKNNHSRNWETIETFHKAGINCTVGLAVQDFDDDVLKAIKRDNIQSMETNMLRNICAEKGIPTRNELILGLPKQSYQSFVGTLTKAMPAFPKHDFILFLCRLLDNTELANPEERKTHQIQTRKCRWVSPKGEDHGIIDEYQELIVSTSALPLADWKRTYRFANIASMGYNKYFLRSVFSILEQEWGISKQQFIEQLMSYMERADRNTVMHQLWLQMERYIDSILSEQAYQLPYFSQSDRPWELDEALSITVLLNKTQFYTELYHCTALLCSPATHTKLKDLIHYQAALIPSQQAAGTVQQFRWDWRSFEQTQNVPISKHTQQYTAVQPFYSSLPDSRLFVSTYLSLMQARSITTQQLSTMFVELEPLNNQDHQTYEYVE